MNTNHPKEGGGEGHYGRVGNYLSIVCSHSVVVSLASAKPVLRLLIPAFLAIVSAILWILTRVSSGSSTALLWEFFLRQRASSHFPGQIRPAGQFLRWEWPMGKSPITPTMLGGRTQKPLGASTRQGALEFHPYRGATGTSCAQRGSTSESAVSRQDTCCSIQRHPSVSGTCNHALRR